MKEFSIEKIFFSLKSVSYKAASVRPLLTQGQKTFKKAMS
ncbi:hypothetical protein SGO_1508 [Streptococcus gordonii str. Challis substr. CH1]|uniref:Uncharacterized protein n=1 Tax=Streptococcus gordonii (strain Challis / ATCC 35105 / BCRC 15272 / CH1 / DL1 / V288) TaxID=467705 RepID=A8AYC7_STRGC|nr:hypothetical protein SGO_1508 [Streptococcus gordonii str. Challis substr. CH1]